MQKEKDIIEELYQDSAATHWAGSRTMEHPSGIFGRKPVMRYLHQAVIKPGDTIVDVGCGAGYVSLQMAAMTGEAGKVIGVDMSESMLAEAAKSPAGNVQYLHGDATRLPLGAETADVVTSFMLLHNLDIVQVRATAQEAARILKPSGTAVFLTMHPRALDTEWDMNCMFYEKKDIERYRCAADKEGVHLRGFARNLDGSEKKIALIHHTMPNMQEAFRSSALKMAREMDLFIDGATARAAYGAEAVRQAPGTPTFWAAIMKKPATR